MHKDDDDERGLSLRPLDQKTEAARPNAISEDIPEDDLASGADASLDPKRGHPLIVRNGIPIVNAASPEYWADDADIALRDIMSWLTAWTSPSAGDRATEEGVAREQLAALAVPGRDLAEVLLRQPKSLPLLRALTRRYFGVNQFAAFIKVTQSRVERFEDGIAARKAGADQEFADRSAELILQNLDYELVPWIASGTQPSPDQLSRAAVIAVDRTIRRLEGTQLRYDHEPRQRGKLIAYLKQIGYAEAPKDAKALDLPPGTYSQGRNVQARTPAGEINQQVDLLVQPLGSLRLTPPVFVEAKTMVDSANPNKRQKEEAQKIDALRRRWASEGEHIFFILLLGGIAPPRYLHVEADSGLDWIWEHRVEDLKPILDAAAGMQVAKLSEVR